jgi:hypothetical protein
VAARAKEVYCFASDESGAPEDNYFHIFVLVTDALSFVFLFGIKPKIGARLGHRQVT